MWFQAVVDRRGDADPRALWAQPRSPAARYRWRFRCWLPKPHDRSVTGLSVGSRGRGTAAPPADQQTHFPDPPQSDTISVMSRRLSMLQIVSDLLRRQF
jgi:hypothetical protein